MKSSWKFKILLVSFVILLHGLAHADSDRLNCDTILQSGVFNKSISLDHQLATQQTRSALCQKSSYSEGGEGEFSYKLIGGSAKYSKSKSESYCTSNDSDNLFARDKADFVSDASPVLSEAWIKCLQLQATSFFFYQYIEPHDSRVQSFTYVIALKKPGDISYDSAIKDWTVAQNVSCYRNGNKVETLKGEIISPGGIKLLCKRNADEPSAIAVTVTQGGQNLNAITIPALPLDPCDESEARKHAFHPSCVQETYHGTPEQRDGFKCDGQGPDAIPQQKTTITNACPGPMQVTLFENTTAGPKPTTQTLAPEQSYTILTCRGTGERDFVAIPKKCNVRRPTVEFKNGSTIVR
jgi:hypothetical protein